MFKSYARRIRRDTFEHKRETAGIFELPCLKTRA
jgi:hypothetical protein